MLKLKLKKKKETNNSIKKNKATKKHSKNIKRSIKKTKPKPKKNKFKDIIDNITCLSENNIFD